jgi:hypothetical protein
MRAPAIERSKRSPVFIAVGALVLALCAFFLLRPGTDEVSLAGWPESVVVENPPEAVPTAPAAVPSATPASPPPLRARVGLQVGHWRSEELPDEFAVLRAERGASAGGVDEVDINLAVAGRVAELLRARGVTVDILPATIPPGYRADAFVAIHCDYNNSPGLAGYKLARFRASPVPDRADALLGAIAADYGAATGQRPDPHITRAMTGYYAFNAGDFRHAIAPATPGVIIELGFLTNAADRALLTTRQDVVAGGLAGGIVRFLEGR